MVEVATADSVQCSEFDVSVVLTTRSEHDQTRPNIRWKCQAPLVRRHMGSTGRLVPQEESHRQRVVVRRIRISFSLVSRIISLFTPSDYA